MRIIICDHFGNFCNARALIDQGTDTSLVSESFARRLRLSRRKSSVKILGIGGQVVSRGQVTLTLTSNQGITILEVNALILPELPMTDSTFKIDPTIYTHLQGLQLTDPNYLSGDPCQILLGASVYSRILQECLRRGKADEPIAQLP